MAAGVYNDDAATSVVLRRTHHHVELVFLAIGLLVMVSTAAEYLGGNYIIGSNARQLQALNLVSDWDRLIFAVRAAELSERQFLLSGAEEDLQAFEGATAAVAPLLQKISGEEVEQETVAQLRSLTLQRIEHLRSAVDLRRDHPISPQEVNEIEREGKNLMEQLTDLTRKLRQSRESSVAWEMDQQDNSARRWRSIFILVGAANIIFLGWSYGRIDHAIKARDAALSMRYASQAAETGRRGERKFP